MAPPGGGAPEPEPRPPGDRRDEQNAPSPAEPEPRPAPDRGHPDIPAGGHPAGAPAASSGRPDDVPDTCPHCHENPGSRVPPQAASEACCGPPEAQPEDAALLAAVRTRPTWRFPRNASASAVAEKAPHAHQHGRGGARRPLLAVLLLLAAAVLVPLCWDLGVLGAHGLMREAPAKAAPTRVQVAVPEDGTVEAEVEMAFRHNALLATSLELRRIDCRLLTAEGLPAAALAARGATVASLAPGLFRPGGPPGRVATTVRGTEIDVDRLFDAAELKCEMRLVARFMGFARVGFTLPASYDLKAAAAAPEERRSTCSASCGISGWAPRRPTA